MKFLFYLFLICTLASCTKYTGSAGTTNSISSGYWKIAGVQYNQVFCKRTVYNDNTGYLFAVDDTNKVKGELSNSLIVSFNKMPTQNKTYNIKTFSSSQTSFPSDDSYVYVRLVTGAAYDSYGPYGATYAYQYLSASPVNNYDKLYVSINKGKINLNFSNATMYKVQYILFNDSQLNETVSVEGNVKEN